MLNLFLIPEWLVILTTLLMPLWLLGRGKTKIYALFWMVMLFSFDGLNINIGNTSLNALKISALISVILLPFLTPKLPKYVAIALLYPAWLVVRDLYSQLDMAASGIPYSLITSASSLGIVLGLICFAWIVASSEAPELILQQIATIVIYLLIINAIISVYQFVAYKFGLPINGINSAYTRQAAGGLKYAAFNIDGQVFFRSYSLYGEPKFLGAVTVVSFAFVMIINKMKIISNSAVAVVLIATLVILVVSASTSAFLGFGFVSLILALTGNLSRRAAWAVILGAGLGLAVSTMFFDLNELFETRVDARMTASEGALEHHEQYYFQEWTRYMDSLMFGLGYAYFGSSVTDEGFRLIPNSPIIWIGVSGGMIGIMFFFLSICTRTDIRHTLPIFCALLAFNTNSSVFLALLFSFAIRRYLAQECVAGASKIA
jgi:hypothetical protein